MATKTILPVQQVFSAALANQTMTGTNVLTSQVTCIDRKDNISYLLSWTGTPTGTFVLQGSVDYNPNLPQSAPGVGSSSTGTWVNVGPLQDSSGNAPAASGASGNILLDLQQLTFPYVRIQYTNSASTGVLTGFVSGKSLGT